jgi:hypothetical protein
VRSNAAGGIAPHRVLPVTLDVGTDNQSLLKDPYYIGLVQNRLRGDAYFELVDEFLDAVRRRFPNVFVQFEDFSSDVAMNILSYYRDDLCENHTREPVCVFNDDIQGTGAVTTAGLFSGLINRGESPENLKDQRIMIAGAGMFIFIPPRLSTCASRVLGSSRGSTWPLPMWCARVSCLHACAQVRVYAACEQVGGVCRQRRHRSSVGDMFGHDQAGSQV